MGEKEKAIATLKLTREMLVGFSQLIETLRNASAQYGIPMKELESGSALGDTLVKALPPERLGLLIKAVMGTADMRPGLTNFMNYDQYQLDGLYNKLQSTIEDFDKVLEGL